MSHKDKKPHGFSGFGMVFSCELLVLSPGPHVGFGTEGAGLLWCSDIFQQAVIHFSLRVLHVSVQHQRLSLGIFGSLAVVWGQPDPMKEVSCFHEQQDSQVSTKSPVQFGEDSVETLKHLPGLKRTTQGLGRDFWQGHGVIG